MLGPIPLRCTIRALALGLLLLLIPVTRAQEAPAIYPQLGHSVSVQKAVLSADGRYLLSGGWAGLLKLWDAGTGREIRTLAGHRINIVSLALSPDGVHAVSYGLDEKVILWDLRTGVALRTIALDQFFGDAVSFLEGGRLFMARDHNRAVRIWATATGQEVASQRYNEGGRPEFMVIAPDGRRTLTSDPVVETAPGEMAIRIWDLRAHNVLHQFRKTMSPCAAFTPDGAGVLSTRHDHRLELWEAVTGRTLWLAQGHTGSIDTILVSAQGGKALTVSRADGTARLWDLTLGRELGSIAVPEGQRPLELAPDGGKVLFGNGVFGNGTFKLYDTHTGQELATFHQKADHCDTLAFAPGGDQLLTTGWGAVTLRNAVTGVVERTFAGNAALVSTVAWAPDRNRAALVEGSNVSIWDLETGTWQRILKGHDRSVTSAAFAPGGNTLATASLDGSVRLWDLHTGKARLTLSGQGGAILSLAWAPDGRRLASAGNDALIRLWDADTGALQATLAGHVQGRNAEAAFTGVYAVAFSPDGTRLASAGADGTVRVWNPGPGTATAVLRGHTKDVTGVAFSPDGALLVSGGRDATLRIWDLAQGAAARTLDSQGGVVSSVAWSPDGAHIASRGLDETVRIWDVGTWSEARTLRGQSHFLNMAELMTGVAFSPDSRRILFCDAPGVVGRLWDVTGGRELAQFIRFTDDEWITFTDTGFFEASPQGGRHLNVRTGNEVSGIDQFFTKFYRPEMIRAALAGHPIPVGERITDIAAGRPAPGVRIASPAPAATLEGDQAALTVQVLDHGGGIGNLLVFLNGVQVANGDRGIAVKEIQIALLQQTRGLNEVTAIKVLQHSIGSAVFAASSDTQAALEGYQGHGLFTFFLLEGLQGKADFKREGYVTVRGLADYVEEQVLAVSEAVFKKQQAPTIQTSTNFPIGKVDESQNPPKSR